jgi:hypothetical protein
LGISFESPSSWAITEKRYLFDVGKSDVYISEFKYPSVYRSFNYINSSEEADQNLKLRFKIEELIKAHKDQLISKYKQANAT